MMMPKDLAGAGGRGTDGRCVSQARDLERNLLPRSVGRQTSKALEDENAKLKKLLAEAMLDNAMLKDVASKKW
jgi:hypothetical protein